MVSGGITTFTPWIQGAGVNVRSPKTPANGVTKTYPFVYFSWCFKKIERFILMKHRVNQKNDVRRSHKVLFLFSKQLNFVFGWSKKKATFKEDFLNYFWWCIKRATFAGNKQQVLFLFSKSNLIVLWWDQKNKIAMWKQHLLAFLFL